MICNYHTHTRWCRHGEGEIEEYIQEAIAKGLQEIAITDHLPIDNTKYLRMPWSDFEAYDADLNRVIEKYQNQIKIIKGMECEYYPGIIRILKKLKSERNYQCFILGQHFSYDQSVDYFHMHDPQADIIRYTTEICEGLETGFFQICAHPEVFLANSPQVNELGLKSIQQIFETCAKLGIVVEINANGLRKQRGYPNKEVWELSKNYKLTVIINSDAHKPSMLVDEAIVQVEKFADECGITVCEKLEIFK